MMDWTQIPYFLAVARSGSLRGAAEQLNATHATVRRHLEALETSYSVQLFRRSRKGLELTPAGEALLPDLLAAEKLLTRGRNGVQGLDREASGLIRISLDPMTGHHLLAPVLARFAALYPEIDLEIRLTFDIESITGLETDISIRHAADITEDVVARKLFALPIGILASRDYVQRHAEKAGKQGEGLNWIGYGPVPELQRWVDASPFAKARVRHTVADPEMHLHLVREGGGMSFLPLWALTHFPELQQMPGSTADFSRSTWVLLHADLRRVKRVRLLVDYLTQALLQDRDIIRGI